MYFMSQAIVADIPDSWLPWCLNFRGLLRSDCHFLLPLTIDQSPAFSILLSLLDDHAAVLTISDLDILTAHRREQNHVLQLL